MATQQKHIFCVLIFFITFASGSCAQSRLTNVQCETFDPTFMDFPECELKVIKRGVIGLNMHARFLKLPINTLQINFALLKKANGYKPFLYNITDDFCRFLKNHRRNAYLNVFMDFVGDDSNLNHTCPVKEDVIVHNLVIREDMFRHLPLPTDEYMVSVLLATADYDWKLGVKVYINRIEE